MGLASYKIQREPVKRKPIGHEDGASVHKCVQVIFYFLAVRVLCIVLDGSRTPVHRQQSRRAARYPSIRRNSQENLCIRCILGPFLVTGKLQASSTRSCVMHDCGSRLRVDCGSSPPIGFPPGGVASIGMRIMCLY